MVNDFLANNLLTATERSVHRDIYTHGESNEGGCFEWDSFVGVDVSRQMIDYVPVKLTFLSAEFLHQDLNATDLVCEGSRFTTDDDLDGIVAALMDTSTLNTDTYSTFQCNGTEWKVGACSSGHPAICVNCSNPCLETERTYTLNCAGGTTADALNVIILDFDPAILAPEISMMSLLSEEKNSVTVQLTLAEASGAVVCAAYQSSLNYVPDTMFVLSLHNEIIDISSLQVNFTISGLEPSTAYDVFCGTYSILGQAMSMDKVMSGSTVTQCCRSLVVTLASSIFMDNEDYPNAVEYDVGSILPNDLVVEINATHSLTSTSKNPPHFIQPFSKGMVTFTNSSLSGKSSLAYLQQVSGFYKLSVQLSGSSASQYEVVYGFGDTFEVLQSFQEPAAPTLSSASFSPDGTRVQVHFDSLTNRAGFVNQVSDCTVLFSATGLDANTACTWLSDSKVSVFLTGDGAASVGSEITLTGGVVQAKCTVTDCSGWVYSATQSVTITSPTSPLTPTILMSGSDELGPCDDLVIDISGSTGAGGRSWASVSWAVESLQVNHSEVLDYLTSNANVNDVSLPITVPGSLLYSGFGYNVVVNVCNFLGACGRVSHYFTVGDVESVPVVTMESAKVLNVYRFNQLSLSGSAIVYTCGGGIDSTGIDLEWTLFKGGVQQTLASTSVDPTSYILPKYSLEVSSTYEVVLKAQHAASKKYSSTSTSISVQAGQLVAQVNVASEFGLRVSQEAKIDASASFDEDVYGLSGLDAGLVFSFQCVRVLPSYSEDCGLNQTTTGPFMTVSVPNNNVSFVDNVYEITVFVTHSSDSRTAQTSVRMSILPSLAAAISLTSNVNTVMNPTTKLALIGTIDVPADGVAVWQVDDSSVDLTAASLSPVSKSLILANGSTVTRLTVSLVLKSDSLLEGSTYLFTLMVSLRTGHNSSSAVVVTTNTPPLPGGFSVTPTSGTELNTTFRFIAFRWEDVDLNLPLTYAFASHSALGGYSVFRTRREKTSTESKLAAGIASLNYEYGVRVQVYDILDGRSTANSEVRVEPQSNITDADLTNSLNNVSSAGLREAVNVVSGVINSVSCDDAGNCTQLHREECGSLANKCGSCLDGYYGESGAANSMCYPDDSTSSGTRRLLTGLTAAATSCSSDGDCAVELMEECDLVSSQCVPKLKGCDEQCSAHGSCELVSNYYAQGDPSRLLVDECKVTDSSCSAQCVCDGGFAGESCEHTVSAFESAQDVRHQLLLSYEVLMGSENPTPDAVVSWLEGLAAVAAHSRLLSEASKELLVSLCSSVLDIAGGLSLPYEDVVQVEKVLSLTLFGGASSSLDSALSLLDKFGRYVVGDLQVGQNPTVVVSSQYRLSAFSVDGLSSLELLMGRSGLEVATGASAQAVTLPASAGSEPYKVLLRESYSMMQSDASTKELHQSVPLELFVDSSLCSDDAAEGSCSLTVELLNFEFGQHVEDEAMSYFTSCTWDEAQVLSYTCPSGVNVTAYCNGTMNGVIESNCSIHVPTSQCDALSDVSTGIACSTLQYSVDVTVCQCAIPNSGVSSWEVEYASLASSVLTNSSSIFTPVNDDALGSSSSTVDVQSSVVLYVVVVFLLYMLVVVLKPSPSKKSGTDDTPSALISSPQEHLDGGLPAIFTGQPYMRRMFEELGTHHRWSCVFFKSFDDGSASTRLLSVFTITSFVFFVNSLLHEMLLGTYPVTDTVRGSFLIAAFISVVGGPLFVMITVGARQLQKSEFKGISSTSNSELLVEEYTTFVSTMKCHDGDNVLDAWGLSDHNFDTTNNFDSLTKCDLIARKEKAAMSVDVNSLDAIISRLLFIFFADFVDGIDSSVLTYKDERWRCYLQQGSNNKVETSIVRAFFLVVDMAMIGCTVIFALSASRDVQYAWCQTFAVWIVVEVLFVSTVVALWTHVWLPSFSYSALQRTKDAVIQHLLMTTVGEPGLHAFNAAKHFFVSHRLAALLPEIESDAKTAVLKFSTEWPRERFVAQGVVPRGSATSGLWYHIVRGCANMHHPEHDMLVLTITSLVVGFITMLLGVTYRNTPDLALTISCLLGFVFVCIWLVGAISFALLNESKSDDMEQKRMYTSTSASFSSQRDSQNKSSNVSRKTSQEIAWQYSTHQGDEDIEVTEGVHDDTYLYHDHENDLKEGDDDDTEGGYNYSDHYGDTSEVVVGGQNDFFMGEHGNIKATNGGSQRGWLTKHVQHPSKEVILGDDDDGDEMRGRKGKLSSPRGLQLQRLSRMTSSESIDDENVNPKELERLTAQSERLSSVLARL